MIIAIDGPAGAGKSTVAKGLAKRMGFAFLDTGAMYRALTLKALRANLDLTDENALEALAKSTTVELNSKDGDVQVLLDDEDVSQAIRTVEVTNNTFYAARAPKIRAILVQWQKALGEKQSLVVEGRDVTTVVFPHAEYKFYLDADIQERARRRYEEFKAKGNEISFEQVIKELEERDHKDTSREVGALKKAEDAIVIDSTGLSVEESVNVIMEHIKD